MIEVFTKPTCIACVEMKKALSNKRIQFVERVIDSDVTLAEVRDRFPASRAIPILAVGKHALGGVEELQALIETDMIRYLL